MRENIRKVFPVNFVVEATRGIVSIDGFHQVYNSGLSIIMSSVLSSAMCSYSRGLFSPQIKELGFDHYRIQVARLYKNQLRINHQPLPCMGCPPLYKIQLRKNHQGPSSSLALTDLCLLQHTSVMTLSLTSISLKQDHGVPISSNQLHFFDDQVQGSDFQGFFPSPPLNYQTHFFFLHCWYQCHDGGSWCGTNLLISIFLSQSPLITLSFYFILFF